jgi:hypothetical protein
MQDELAETQIAEPGYAGTNYEINVAGYEFELFDYWNDLEYVDNAYWDGVSVPSRELDPHEKRLFGSARGKKLRAKDTSGLSSRGYDPISFRSRTERDHYVAKNLKTITSRTPVYALFPDWRVRLTNEPERRQPGSTTLPVLPEVADAESADGADSEMEYEEEDEEEDETDGGLQIDPEMLKAILKDKLGQAGLDGLDEGAFMETISKLMSGDDTAADGLADSLLGNLSNESGGGALSSWLTGQGVSLDDGEEEDLEEENNVSSAEKTTKPSPMVAEQQRQQKNPGKRASEDDASDDIPLKRPRRPGSDKAVTSKLDAGVDATPATVTPPSDLTKGPANRKSSRNPAKRKG